VIHQPIQRGSFYTYNGALPKLPPDQTVYCYPHHEVYYDGRNVMQTRSGPNWQGSVMTLTTCKHYLRTTRKPADWAGVWFAGFLPKAAVGDGQSYLLYIAQVSMAFENNYDLAMHLGRIALPKLTTKNPLGDIYVPKRTLHGPEMYIPANYVEPVGHVRHLETYSDGTPKWHRDIAIYKNGRYPCPLLMGRTALWNTPAYYTTRPLHRSGFRTTTNELPRILARRDK
jgi:hypothetical protein